MAEIVVLNRWRLRPSRRPPVHIGRPQEKEGKLLLFTGVRYERAGDASRRQAENALVRTEQK